MTKKTRTIKGLRVEECVYYAMTEYGPLLSRAKPWRIRTGLTRVCRTQTENDFGVVEFGEKEVSPLSWKEEENGS